MMLLPQSLPLKPWSTSIFDAAFHLRASFFRRWHLFLCHPELLHHRLSTQSPSPSCRSVFNSHGSPWQGCLPVDFSLRRHHQPHLLHSDQIEKHISFVYGQLFPGEKW
uniref:Uncharacterized protein n=1 Tax=Cucumis sativus TaxID=3659 RepID=A0A0A0LA14_CUCSA